MTTTAAPAPPRFLPPHGGAAGPVVAGLFEGYGGLTAAVHDVFGGNLAWYAEYDGLPTAKKPRLTGPARILADRFPGIPNIGDVTAANWAALPRIDILTGGSPCQDLSHAGRRAGMTEGTRSNLWVAMREAIATLRPSVVVWENVRGAFSAEADSDLVTDPGLLDQVRRRDGEPVLRALGRVLGDFSDLGYDTRWYGVRASDVGATHGRFRVFVLATDASCDPWWEQYGDLAAAAHAGGEAGLERPGLCPDGAGGDGRGLTPRGDRPADLSLLPTPAVNDMGASYTPEEWDAWTAKMKAEHGNGNGHGASLSIEALRLLPTPTTQDGSNDGGPSQFDRNTPPLNAAVHLLPTPNASEGRKGDNTPASVRREQGHQVYLSSVAVEHLLPTPSVAAATGGQTSRSGDRKDEALLGGIAADAAEGRLLPTPAASDALGARNSTCWRDPERRDGHPGDTLLDVMWKQAGVVDPKVAEEEGRLLPTPRASDGTKGGPNQAGSSGDLMLPSAVQPGRLVLPDSDPVDARWGDYAPVIRRWEAIIGRPAPDPTQPSKKGNPQLAAAFVEWMMGLPAGWVTDVPITRNEMLKALGNGVVPQQAAYALRVMLGWQLPAAA